MAEDAQVEMDGHLLKLTNLGKVLYPETGTTKSEVIAYYAEVAHVMLPHITGRPVTRKRWPDGVAAKPFFHKNMDKGTPDWVQRFAIAHSDHTNLYPIIDSPAGLAWLGQNAALEIHVPQWRFELRGGRFGPRGDSRSPDRLVFDLDPGPGVELAECAAVARIVRDRLAADGHRTVPVTSGSKGIHLYAHLDGSLSSAQACDYAHHVAEELEQELPDRVLSRMTRALRTEKVFLDWSQNNANKTTIGPYSLRGRDHPMVAAPRDWDELDDPRIRQLDYREVLRRIEQIGDPMAGLEMGKAARKKAKQADGKPAADKLAKYRSMRSADRTPEPVPPESGDLPHGHDDTFVIQEHHASRLHWDFRLERGGVLVSWALPKGIPTGAARNNLAVMTEDHPLDYAGFAGVIPAAEYGGGWVTIWDAGRYETEKWRDDEVIVTLHGQRAQGRFALIRTRENQWLIHRTKGQIELPAVVPLKSKPDDLQAVWHSNREPGPMSAKAPEQGRGESARRGSKHTEPLPTDLTPMLAGPGTLADLSADKQWRVEGKWDGIRALAYVGDGPLRLISRNDKTFTGYPELEELNAALGDHRAVLDGEIVAFDEHNRTDFGLLQQRMKLTRKADIERVRSAVPVVFLVFDILHLDEVSLLGKTLDDRRRVLEALELRGEHLLVPDRLTGDPEKVLAQTRRLHWEGIVVKAADSTYQPGTRSRNWLKLKNQRDQEVVIVGWRPGSGRRDGTIGALLLAVPGAEGLEYAGKVGTGFTDAMLDDLLRMLHPLERRSPPVTGSLPRPETRDAHWVSPELVGEVRFAEWTREGYVRQASWRGLRPDKSSADVRRE